MSVSVNLSEDLADRLGAEATRRGLSVDELIGELAAQLPVEGAPKRRLAFAGIGASTSGRSAAEADALLAEGFGRD